MKRAIRKGPEFRRVIGLQDGGALVSRSGINPIAGTDRFNAKSRATRSPEWRDNPRAITSEEIRRCLRCPSR